MSYPVWPFSSARFERDSWQRQRQEARRFRQTDAGPPSSRRRFSAVGTRVSLSVVLTRTEREVFDRFFAEDCLDGASFFWMPDPATDGWALLDEAGQPLLTETGQPLLASAQWLCAWGDETPSDAMIGGVEFRKSFNVVVMP